VRRNHCWTLKKVSFNFLIIIYQLLWISGLLKTHPIILIIKREYLFMICEIRAYKCYIPRMYISGFDFHKRLDVGIGLAQSVKQTHVPYGSSYSSWKEEL